MADTPSPVTTPSSERRQPICTRPPRRTSPPYLTAGSLSDDPVLLIHGSTETAESDWFVHSPIGSRLAELGYFAGRHAETIAEWIPRGQVWLAGGRGHSVHWEAPDDFIGRVTEFFTAAPS